ncbi:S8 family serine peptidase [Alteromonas sp. ASW11-130]|uniref:S8 family serine peptidase n=1 Tax=Alteromonas sp. ASW11-130 TaxID=3015775 RepID=UPI0022426310|nr:S8 family serine peptidase [Alteromonas sp. ASW11-130]MCW8092603.1 S8 family serine peptidase [Alteromonas sp. ASW11-130]
MKVFNRKSLVSVAVAFSLPCSVFAKTFDEDLAAQFNQNPSSLQQVIVTFDGKGAPTTEQLTALTTLGIDQGVSLQNLPIVGILATKAQVEQLYQRDDVVSVWNNESLRLENHESTQITGVQAMRADSELRRNGVPFSGKGIGVVVNDSGVDGTHSDLAYPNHVVQNVLAQTNLHSLSDLLPITYQENIANTDIGGGHGTHVAGTVGGNGAKSGGLHAGVAPGADIIGYGSGAGLFILDTLGGFDYALTHQFNYNIRVISNSFGSTSDVGTDFNPDHPTNVATKALADRGIITVFSAGNSGPGESTITGNFKKAPWVVTVAAGDKNGELAEFSSRGVEGKEGEVVVDGEVYTWQDRPTITAPGVDVISARASTSSLGGLSAQDDVAMIDPEHLPFYTVSSGTSMAAPHVSGIVALMLEADPTLHWQDVKRILQNTATPMAGLAEWEAGAGYVNAHAAITAVVNGEAVFGDTVKQNRDFNGKALVKEGASFTLTTTYLPAGESPTETFEVSEDVAMVVASATIETATAFVLEDPAGNRYGSGIGLPVLGSAVGTTAPGMAGTWKLYSRGIGSISGVSVDPLGLTNGVGIPASIDVTIRLLETAGFEGIADTQGEPSRPFVEYVTARHLMDATSQGFMPHSKMTRGELADTLTLSANVRQSIKGNQLQFTDADVELSAALNSVSETGSILHDIAQTDEPVMLAKSDTDFLPENSISREELAYSLVQALGLQSVATSFDQNSTIIAVVFDQAVEVVDTKEITPELRGYVQSALAIGLLDVTVEVEQGEFDVAPTLKAYFNPSDSVTRGEAAYIITEFDQLNTK